MGRDLRRRATPRQGPIGTLSPKDLITSLPQPTPGVTRFSLYVLDPRRPQIRVRVDLPGPVGTLDDLESLEPSERRCPDDRRWTFRRDNGCFGPSDKGPTLEPGSRLPGPPPVSFPEFLPHPVDTPSWTSTRSLLTENLREDLGLKVHGSRDGCQP
ncbi:Hypothetical predicted protein [Marmota monax]|uniref:Uncharacterized protein n=1 Tax=Marmota monax TaxID=9995 RepID=A0A5E4A930_MARMO|nr:Hypothetical predicted protein [Marmota monax]